jgi:hypothetical protein
MENVGLFYGRLVHLPISWSFGIVFAHFVYFSALVGM